jgi:hypothetical protein
MEKQNVEKSNERNKRSRRSEETSTNDVAIKAVYRESDVKQSMGPSVSMTVVAEIVEFTQVFNF